MVFVMRKLDRVPQSLADKLRALRRGQAVSLDMMESATHIQRKYLYALEHGEYEKLPEPLYTRNFIRTYARVLNADEDYFLELYNDECGSCDCVQHMRTPRQKVRAKKLMILNKFIRFGFLSISIFIFFGYLGWQIQSIVEPPDVYIYSPIDSSTTSEAMMTVNGMVDGESTVYVNGAQVVVGSDRSFSVEIDLERGLNIIKVEAERRYSKKAVVERRVVFIPKSIPQVGFID